MIKFKVTAVCSSRILCRWRQKIQRPDLSCLDQSSKESAHTQRVTTTSRGLSRWERNTPWLKRENMFHNDNFINLIYNADNTECYKNLFNFDRNRLIKMC